MSLLGAVAVLLACWCATAAPADESPCLTPLRPDLYHDGWIDFNKNGTRDPYEDPGMAVEDRIDDLVSRMTLDEKTMQMVTLYGFPRVLKDELPTPEWRTAAWKDGIGNIDEHLNGNEGTKPLPRPEHDMPWSLHARAVNEVQKFFIEQTRLGVPADFTNEGIRGVHHTQATSFPAQIGVAATWDKELVLEIGRITGREARALGYSGIYSPVLDLPRDPRWGRTVECYSEDPYLTSELGVRQVRGIQESRVASTVKHFAVYSVPKGGRDGEARTDPAITWRDVQTIFLPPFRRAIRDGGAMGVMSSYNDYDGIPITASRQFLTGILREEWGFRGYVVSDSRAVEFIHKKHRVATDNADGIRQAVEAGLNVRTDFTKPEDFVLPLRQLVRTGRLAESVIDARVRDVLRVKFWQGWFDQPYRDPASADVVVRAPAHLAVADRAARESIVLLKNDPAILPLAADLKKLAVIGPLADAGRAWWSRYAPQRLDFVTPLEGIRARLGDAVEVLHEEGVDVVDATYPESDVVREAPPADVQRGIDAAVRVAAACDAVVLVLGENDAICRESASRVSLDLPGHQESLLRAVQAVGKPTVLVIANGRPLSVNWAVRHVPAIVTIWFPGENAGTALAEVLCGDVSPSGKLPITFPRSVGQVPFNFPAKPGSQAKDPGQVEGPLFPFGHGLSYTTFAYRDLRIDPAVQGPGGKVTVACRVANTGSVAGDEVVQLYVRDDYGSVITPDKVLRGFERVSLAPAADKVVTFTLGPEHLEIFGRDGHWGVEPGRFTVMIGSSSEDIRLEGGFEIDDGSSRREREAAASAKDDPT